MTSVGSVEISVSLARGQFARDVAQVRNSLAQIPNLNINAAPATQGLNQVSQGLNQVNQAATTANASIGGVAIAAQGLNQVGQTANAASVGLNQINQSAASATTALGGVAGASQGFNQVNQSATVLQTTLGGVVTASQGFNQVGQIVSATSQGFNQVNQSATVLQTTLGGVVTASQGFNQVGQIVGTTSQGFNQVNQSATVLQTTLGGVVTASQGLNQIGQTVASASQGFNQANQAANSFDQTLNQTEQSAVSLKATIGGMTTAVGAALSLVAEQSKQAAIAFDSATAKAATLTNDASGLAGSMRQLSADLKYQANSTDLLNSSYDVLSSGYSKTADVTEILKNATYAAKGGFSDVNTVADATTTILNSYGIAADQAAHVTDVLIATQNAGKITVAQYAGMIGATASTAAAAGVSLEEFSAFVATATAKGVQASSAVAGMNQAISSILSPSLQASRLAKELGIQFDAAALKSKGLAGIMADLNAKGAATPAVLTELFGSVLAVSTLMPSAGQNVESFNKNLAYIKDSAGLAQQAADQVSSSFEGRLTQASNQANEAFVSLGQGILKVASPIVGAAGSMIAAFNGLPEPVKQTIGVALGLSGAVLTVAGGITTFTALLPVANAGLATIATTLGITSAATAANTAVTSAASLSTGIFTANISLSNAALVADAIATRASAVAKGLYAAATSQAATATLAFVGSLATMAAQLALVAAAAYTVSELFKRSAGAQFAQQVEENNKKMVEFREQLNQTNQKLGETQKATDDTSRSLELMGQAFNKSGPIEALRVGLAELHRALGGTSDATSTYGEELSVLTAQQRGNQLAMLALDKQFQQTGATMEATNAILSKYGLLTVDAGDKQRLGAAGIAKFKAEVADQIKVLDNYIDTLKSQKAPTAEQQKLIDENVKNLEKQKQILRGRIVAVEADTEATKANAKAAKDAIIDINALSAAYDNSVKNLELSAQKKRAKIDEDLAQGNITAEKAQSKLLAIEADGLKARQNLIASEMPKLAAAKVGAKPEEVEKISKKIQDLEGESANARSQVAQNLIKQKKAANEEAVANEENAVKKASLNIINSENDKLIKIAKLQLSGKISSEKASQEIVAVKLKSNQAEINAEQDKLARITALRKRGAITAKEFANQESEINSNVKKLKLQNLTDEVKAKEDASKRQEEARKREEEVRKQELARIEKANSNKLTSLELKTSKSILGIKQDEAAGNIKPDESSKRILALEQETVKSKIELNRQEAAQVDELEKRKLLTKEEAAAKRVELEKQAVGLSLELANKEIEERKRQQEKILQAIQERADAEKKAIDETISGLEAEKTARQRIIQAQEQEKQLLESRLTLQKALSATSEIKAQGKIGVVSRALEARRKLDSDPKLDPGVAAVLQSQLNASNLGNASEEQILGVRQKLEAELAAQQDKAAKQQEEAARKLLEIDLSRAKITAQIGYLEAQIAQSKAEQAAIQAQANLEKAQQTGDQKAIALANGDIKAAKLAKEAANQQLGLAEQNVANQTELADNARKTLVAQQEGAQAQRDAANAAREQAAALEVAEARAKAIARYQKQQEEAAKAASGKGEGDGLQVEKAANNIVPRPNNAQAAQFLQTQPLPNLQYEQAQKAQSAFLNAAGGANQEAKLKQLAQTTMKNNPFFQQILQDNGLGNLADLSKKLDNGGVGQKDITKNNVTNNNSDLIQEFQKLAKLIEQVAARPTTVNISSPNPVRDAATFYSDLSKNAVRRNGG